jgi:uncharacterized membrane-anchored protein
VGVEEALHGGEADPVTVRLVGDAVERLEHKPHLLSGDPEPVVCDADRGGPRRCVGADLDEPVVAAAAYLMPFSTRLARTL